MQQTMRAHSHTQVYILHSLTAVELGVEGCVSYSTREELFLRRAIWR